MRYCELMQIFVIAILLTYKEMGSKRTKPTSVIATISALPTPSVIGFVAEEKQESLKSMVLKRLATRKIQLELIARIPDYIGLKRWFQVCKEIYSLPIQEYIRARDFLGFKYFVFGDRVNTFAHFFDCSRNYFAVGEDPPNPENAPSVIWHFMHHLKQKTRTRIPDENELAIFDLIVGFGGVTPELVTRMSQGTSALGLAITIPGFEIWNYFAKNSDIFSFEGDPLLEASLFRPKYDLNGVRIRQDYLESMDRRCASIVPLVSAKELNTIDSEKKTSFLEWIYRMKFVRTLDAMCERPEDVNWQVIPSTMTIESLLLLADPIPNAHEWKETMGKILQKIQDMTLLQRNRKRLIIENARLLFPSPIVDIIRCYAEAQPTSLTLPPRG